MRTLSSAAQAALAATVTRPIYLIEIAFSPVSRLSTAGDVTWNSLSWSGGERVAVSGLSADGSGRQSGRVVIGNADLVFGALVLNNGVADRAVTIWSGDAAALATGDLEMVFSGVIGSAETSIEQVVLNLTSQGSRATVCPRRRIDASSGFNHLTPAGKQLRLGNITYTLQRAP